MKSGWMPPRFIALVRDFSAALEHDPEFRLPSQARRVRCDLCGAYHPGEECARCRDLLEEARAIICERRRDELLERLRVRHRERRAPSGYALHRDWNRGRRTAKRWFAIVCTPTGALHTGLAVCLFALWVALPIARLQIAGVALWYAAIGIGIFHWRTHATLSRWVPYARWHHALLKGRPLHLYAHWGLFALIFGTMAWKTARGFADIRVPSPEPFTPKGTQLWSSADDWDTWARQGTAPSTREAALSLQGRGEPHITATLPFAQYHWTPYRLALSADGRHLYATGRAADLMLDIDTKSTTVTTLVTVGAGARDIAISPDGTQALVANAGADTLSLVDLSTDNVLATIPVGKEPASVVFAPDNSMAYVCCNGGAWTISRLALKTQRVISTIRIGSPSRRIAVSPRRDFILVANLGGGSVRRIRTSDGRLTATIPVTAEPWTVAIAPDASYALVTSRLSPTLSRLRLSDNKITKTFPLPGPAWDIKIAPDGEYAIATCGNSLVYVRPEDGEVVATLKVEDETHESITAKNGNFAYLAHGTNISRVEGGPPRYKLRGIASITKDISSGGISGGRSHPLYLSKQDKADGGTLMYYVASGNTEKAPRLPVLSRADNAQSWRQNGWVPIRWSGNMAVLPSGQQGRYHHFAVFMMTPNTRHTPILKSLTLNYN